jgi:pimeloyl-ACP methyl ester carboxylesterase
MTFSLIYCYGQSTEKSSYGSNLEIGKYVTVNGHKLYHETYGQGTPLLLLHGGLGSILHFKDCIESLSKHFKVIALDSPGHGRSSHVDTLSYPYLTEIISQFIDHLEVDSLYIVGFSDGAVIGLQLAAERPDKVKKLVAIGANTRLNAISEGSINWMRNDLIDWAKDENGWWYTNHLPLISQPEKIDIYLENTKKMWLTDIYIESTKIQSIKIPTMIMQGDRDGIKQEHALELNKDIANSQLCILPNTGHFVFGPKAELVNSIIIEFLNE